MTCGTHVSLLTSTSTPVLSAFYSIFAINPSGLWMLRTGLMCNFRGQQMQMHYSQWKRTFALNRTGVGTVWTTKIHSSVHFSMILPGFHICYAIRSACFSQASVKMIS